MDTSGQGIAFIKRWEGVRTKAYRDSVGIWTIGVGHTSAAGPPKVTSGMVITDAQVSEILAHDLAKFEDRVERVFGSKMPQTLFDGAVSFDFNCGGIDKASWPRRFKDGDFRGAEAYLKMWNKAGGKVLRGLVNRRAAEADLIFRGNYG